MEIEDFPSTQDTLPQEQEYASTELDKKKKKKSGGFQSMGIY